VAKKAGRPPTKELLAAIQMHENNIPATRIAEILGVSRASVFEWIAKYHDGGLVAICTKIASGRQRWKTARCSASAR
jgi:transposase